MKVFLDDLRPCPEGWTYVTTPETAIVLLRTGDVEMISLDHDLGLPEPLNGNAVVKWIEEQVATNGFHPPVMKIHSANPVGMENMIAGICSIHRLAGLPPPTNIVWSAEGKDKWWLRSSVR